MKLKYAIQRVALMVGLAVSSTLAQADPLSAWSLNLSAVGGTDTGPMASVIVDGYSTVAQTVTGFNEYGNPLTFSGSLALVQYEDPSYSGPFNFGLPSGQTDLFFSFSGLGGVLNPDGTASFTPGTGTIGLYLDNTGTLQPQASSVQLATFSLDSADAQDVAYVDGGGANPFYDLNFKLESSVAGLFSDDQGHALNPGAVFSLTVDGLLDPSLPDNPSYDGSENGVATSYLINAGGIYTVNAPAPSVPEPASGLLGLLGLASIYCASSLVRRG